MKKIIAMLLVLVMSVTGLVGCGSSKGNEAGSTSAGSDSDWAYIQDKGKLTVGITLFAPMNYVKMSAYDYILFCIFTGNHA